MTAAAALITAITGLVVAVRQLWPDHSARPAAISTTGAGATIGQTASTGSTAGAAAGTVGFPAGTHAEVGEAAYDIVGSDVTVSNPGQLTLALRVRIANNGRYSANFWNSSFRLRVGADVTAPSNFLDEVVAAGTTDSGEVDFRVDSGTRTATLLIGDDAAKAVSVPITIIR